MTMEEFVQKEIETWGIDYIDELCMKGFDATFVNGKWVWLQRPQVREFSLNR
jgi:hypothetical protein